jgi:hypothetical protein
LLHADQVEPGKHALVSHLPPEVEHPVNLLDAMSAIDQAGSPSTLTRDTPTP